MVETNALRGSMPQRLLLHYDIEDRQHELRDFVAPDDFVLRRRDTPVPFPKGALAYCVDLQAERVLFTCHPHAAMAALFQAPFLYAAQLHGASHAVSVPYERLAECEAGKPVLAPVLIFSPGRTGSTLLTRLLRAASVACASEPDMLAQICRFGREDRLRMGLPMEPALMRACLASVTAALAGGLPLIQPPFVKLRSHCNARPLPLLDALPGTRAVFMLRHAKPWARSRHRAFGETPAFTTDSVPMLSPNPYPVFPSHPYSPSLYAPSPNEPEEQLNFFRSRTLPSFPFIDFTPYMTSWYLREHRPFLLQAIHIVSTFSTQERWILFEELIHLLFTSALLTVESNIDLLLRILTYLAWSADAFLSRAGLISPHDDARHFTGA